MAQKPKCYPVCMEQKSARYLVTSALPYANGPLHVGQIVGA